MQGGGHTIMQNQSSLLTRIREKGKRLTPLYRRWGQLCSCIQCYCYCCSQILLSSVHIWWMNHLAIGQAGSYCLCNKQKGFLHTVTTSVLKLVLRYRTDDKSRGLFPIHQLTRAGNNLLSLFTATNIITSWDLPWNNSETPGCSICCSCIHWSDNKCVVNATPQHTYLRAGKEEHTWAHLTFLPLLPPPSFSL